jgi:hypothetical protein
VRRSILLAAVVAAACALVPARLDAPAAQAGTGLVVGVHDDTLKWAWPGWRFIHAYEDLGLGAIRVTLRWRTGAVALDHLEQLYLERVTTSLMRGNRTVLAIYGGAAAAPATPEERDEYCEFVADALRRARSIKDVVIWNEANSPSFWRPQSGAAAAYVELLARCHDLVHERFPHRYVNLISSTAPRHDPRAFIQRMGEAYRTSGRTRPLVDTFGHNPYPATSGEPPWAEHPGSRMLGQGDYATLVAALQAAFGGTAQPAPGARGVTIWYLEDGFETVVPAERSSRYLGREVARGLVQPVAPRVRTTGVARDQASQLRDAIALAFCQPLVGAFFNFQLVDEERLDGWQSGLLWADGSRKPSFMRFRTALLEVGERKVDCSRFPVSALGLERPAVATARLSSRSCCGQSSSTSTSRSRGPARTSGRTGTDG